MHMKKISNDKKPNPHQQSKAIKKKARKRLCKTTYHKNVLLMKWQNIYLTMLMLNTRVFNICSKCRSLFFQFNLEMIIMISLSQICLISTINN
ncbi:hypothetical protein BT93_H1965 [Corymbia citriodora subsp. variegata]|nr:hypothetical protein BT93_H1965 [Corymbia citriodora subsp. variegata]